MATGQSDYTDTSGSLARKAETTVPTVTKYAALGLLDFVTLANGVKLFRAGQEGRVRAILAERRANRGRRSA